MMNNKQRKSGAIVPLALVAMLLAGLGAPGCKKKNKGDPMLSFVPSDAVLVILLDFAELKKMSEYGQLESIWKINQKDLLGGAALSFVNDAGIRLEEDLGGCTFFVTPPAGEGSMGLAVRANYFSDQLTNALIRHWKAEVEEAYSGVTLYRISGLDRKPPLCIALTKGYVLLGPRPVLESMINASAKGGKSVLDSPTLGKYLVGGTGQVVRVAARVPDLLDEKLFRQPALQMFQPVQTVMMAIDQNKVAARFLFADEEKSQWFADFLQLSKTAIEGRLASNDPRRGVSDISLLYRDATIARDGLEVSLLYPSGSLGRILNEVFSLRLVLEAQKGKQESTMKWMRQIGLGIENYLTDVAFVPRCSSLEELSRLGSFVPFYIQTVPLQDAWGNDFLYLTDPFTPDVYSIASPGRDGVFDGWSQSGDYEVKGMDDFDRDVIYSNGSFTYRPAKK